MHASSEPSPVVIVAKDTNVFVLLVYAIEKVVPEFPWFMQIDQERFVDIRKVTDHIGSSICQSLPQLHAITGCDTTAYKFNIGKIKVIKKIMQDSSSCSLIRNLGYGNEVSDQLIENAKKFIQTVMYSGKPSESYVETRINMYKKIKIKSSASLPADPSSIVQEIKRVFLQCYTWVNCLNPHVRRLEPQEHGWQFDEKSSRLMPKWFTGSQLPPCLVRSKSSRKGSQTRKKVSPGSEADIEDEFSSTAQLPPAKRARRAYSCHVPKRDSNYEAEAEMSSEKMSDSSSEWEDDFSTSSEGFSDSADSDFIP